MNSDDPETVLHDEGWNEVLAKDNNNHLDLHDLLDGDFMPPLEVSNLSTVFLHIFVRSLCTKCV